MSPKLSDALRGMADRAPIGELEVSTHGAARRVRRHRTLRMTANSLVGAGAAAVVAFAVIAPTTGTLPAGEGADMAAAPEEASDGGFAAADTRLAMNMCGSPFSGAQPDQPATLTVVPPDGVEIGENRTVPMEVVLTASAPVTGMTSSPTVLVLWDGIVVGSAHGPALEATDVSLAAGDVVTTTVDVLLVNCWDGAELPGGTYQLAAMQEIFTATVEEPVSVDETPPAVVDPPIEGDGTSGDPGNTSSGSADAAVTFDAGYTLVSEPLDFQNAGEVVEDPFGQYLNPPAPELPDGYLSPDIARELYEVNVRDGAWDMAPGTQRVVMTSDAATPDPTGTAWARSYFGCAWDGGASGTFPTRSADLDLIDVTANLPSRINLSYGWVVDGNPEVNLRTTNTSGFTLPAMYEPNSALLLVRDGRVVGEAYLSNAARNGVDYNAAPPFYEPGSSLGGTYLWREVSGCWNGNVQGEIPPGTYTVVNAQYLYLGNDAVIMYGSDAGDMGATLSAQIRVDANGGTAEPAIAIEPDIFPGVGIPAPDATYAPDYVELQVWTSLGTVTITN